MDFLIFTLACIYFYLPAAMANVGANLSRFVPFFKDLKQPIDGGRKIYGQHMIGEHKNWGGLLFGILFGTIFGVIKIIFIDQHFPQLHFFQIRWEVMIFVYFLMSTAALVGDLIKSIVKRLLRRPAHSAWIPFDEIDHSFFSMMVASIILPISIDIFLGVISIFFFLHIFTNIIAFMLKLKKVPY